jgi:hypothetical protein
MSTVFHTVTWIETDTGITMSLGLEGTISTRADAERVAQAYRAWLAAGYVAEGAPDKAYCARVGILEIAAPDPRLKHPEPCADIDAVIAGIQARIEKRLGGLT